MLLENFRLTSFEVLGGLAVIVEYDKIIDDGCMIYGVEETRDLNVVRFKALQTLTGTLLLPWLPYRVDESLLNGAREPGLAIRFPSATGTGGANAIILDMIGGEFSMITKIAAVMPAQKTRYAEILSVASQNTAHIIKGTARDEADELLVKALDSISGYLRGTIRENLRSLSDLINSLTENVAYNKQLSLEGGDIGLSISKVVILAPIIHGEYETEELVSSLLSFIKERSDKGQVSSNIEFYIAGFNKAVVKNIEHAIRNEFAKKVSNNYNYKIVESRTLGLIRGKEDAEKIAKEIAEMGGSEEKLYVILLDMPDILLEHLTDKISGHHVAIVLHRVRYRKKPRKNNNVNYDFDTKPTVVVIR
ncbi:MAG: hypothetical protein LRS47_03365 [Desulfurococcales archaeon]|nr:hypothetical protein [Desulfurococcales archaeon]